ncbi:MAG: acetyl-CoA acetyltransferase, partial [Peptococcaceae bacterium]|nr:acetyl-CoA acetyltransferase [Peptococcaceae bacterium]
MSGKGIKDRVAIVGMGCTSFGEHWNKSAEDLMVEAAYEAFADAGIGPENVDAYWLGTMDSGYCGITLSVPLKLQYKPVTRVENFCATGSDAFRNACYAVAAGAYDLVVAIGVEKLKDSGYSGLTLNLPPNDGTLPNYSAPAAFSLLAPAYFKKYGLDPAKGKEVLARIAWKNHRNGALN